MRSSGEILSEMCSVDSQLKEVRSDLRKMYFDNIKIGSLCKRANTLNNDVKSYDISQGGEWEGNLYDEGVTYHSNASSAANTVHTTLTTLKTELQTARGVAEEKERNLQAKYDSLSTEYAQAVAEEQAAAERAAAAAAASGY